jgi:type IV pilus assembly protein PilE
LLIVVAIAAILAAIAYPSFQNSIRKSRRADAVATLTQVQQAQERWRSNNPSYAGNAVLSSPHPTGLGVSATTEKGYYTVAISGESATGYTVTATPVNGKSQAEDAGCTPLALTVVNGNVGASGYSPAACWSK